MAFILRTPDWRSRMSIRGDPYFQGFGIEEMVERPMDRTAVFYRSEPFRQAGPRPENIILDACAEATRSETFDIYPGGRQSVDGVEAGQSDDLS